MVQTDLVLVRPVGIQITIILVTWENTFKFSVLYICTLQLLLAWSPSKLLDLFRKEMTCFDFNFVDTFAL